MDLNDAIDNFNRATRHCDNLVGVHRGSGGSRQGRRDREVSINRAIVVLTVAAWQAVVQDFVHACIDEIYPSSSTHMDYGVYRLLAGRLKNEVGRFSTPNAENSRNLLMAAGYDPRNEWTWVQSGGRGVGMVTRTPGEMESHINDWLKIRHAIAHGHKALPQVNVLQSVRRKSRSAA